MITPPNGSAEAMGQTETVSRVARQRNALTPIPPPASPGPGVAFPIEQAALAEYGLAVVQVDRLAGGINVLGDIALLDFHALAGGQQHDGGGGRQQSPRTGYGTHILYVRSIC